MMNTYILYEFGHTVMEAQMSYRGPLQAGEPGKPVVIIQSESGGLRTRNSNAQGQEKMDVPTQ